MKIIELKVCIACQKCKTQILKAVAKLKGIAEISVDEQKGILKVVGDVDPIQVAKQVRKTGKTAVFGSVSEPKPANPPPEKPKPANPPPEKPKPANPPPEKPKPANPPPEKPKPANPPPAPLPSCCSACCRLVEVRYEPYGGTNCSII
ncbi:heavy metal-associated isoprenylated plant protein 43-like isoform X3 [Diospyros lotus]|uniref:heavy metal-associated isoprenylated plant protein 43-like isoform X1 n=1 Tax=Diospyros lotus TaxID=55363 RepID=UPI002255855D|nr:heavy metal-associated isoprenylated plant protein 43-like isoform X1 [Diospyros lotus]XP_052205299.1 heavy metal-associated isoprenylated plant protein 43-like isoform X2 [Diospyros lotus]XP_052205301.1 heavy metal-associated isoprenylated plant protein 43-like isoform X3 [Diospyros lotus]